MFTLDYSLWFDQVLPGLERLNVPIPLGGTSNHFKIEVLRELHGWDPFNVTEDADLGIRLTQKGYRVGVVDSTTFEEAACHTGNWIRQRSRWMKGYMQTFLVHTRRPLHLLRTTGPLGFAGFVFFIGGTVLSALFNPIFWAMYLFWLFAFAEGLNPVFPEQLLFLSLFNLLAGNGAFIYLSMLAPIRRGWLGSAAPPHLPSLIPESWSKQVPFWRATAPTRRAPTPLISAARSPPARGFWWIAPMRLWIAPMRRPSSWAAAARPG
jgi:cellulose synthase/poly-beta-1,6-N-acetylglucosamine synthase-like glycosyltransferase